MSLTDGKATGGGKKQLALPECGPRVGILTGIIDIGLQAREFKGEMKPARREFIPIFTMVNDTYTTDDGKTAYCTLRAYPIKHMPGATRGGYFEFYNGVDPKHVVLNAKGEGNVYKLIGQAAVLNVSHTDPKKDKDGIIYANIESISAFPAGFPLPKIDFTPLIFNQDSPSKDVFDKLGTWTQDQIRHAVGYAGSPLETLLEGKGTPAPQQSEASTEDDDESPV